MFIGDFTSNCQPKTATRCFRGPHWFKEMSDGRIIDAGAAVTKEDLGVVRLSIEPGFDFNTPTVGHCINAVVGEIEKELEEAIVIAPEQRQVMIEIGPGLDLVSFQGRLNQPQQPVNQVIKIEELKCRLWALRPCQQALNAFHD